jgi:hypothetical protein
MHFVFAVEADGAVQARGLMEEASEILENQIAERRSDTYPLVALARGRIKVFQHWFQDEIKDEAAALVSRLKEMQKRFPTDSEIKRATFEIGLIASAPRAN